MFVLRHTAQNFFAFFFNCTDGIYKSQKNLFCQSTNKFILFINIRYAGFVDDAAQYMVHLSKIT